MTEEANSRRGSRFPLRRLFWIAAIVAGVAYVPRLLHQSYDWQLNHVRAVLAEHPEIENVRIISNEDAFYEVEWVEFSIAGKPNSKVTLAIPHGGRIDRGTSLEISRLGPWHFVVFGNGYVGTTSAATGDPVKSDFEWNWIDVGSEGAFANAMPIVARTVGDIISNYDELVSALSEWPDRKAPGVVRDKSGTLLRYYVTKRPLWQPVFPGDP